MQSEFDGLRKVRSALSFLVVSQVLLEAGALFLLLFALFIHTKSLMYQSLIYSLAGTLVILIAFVLYFLSLAKFRSGFKLLRNFYKYLGIGYLGVNVIIIGYVLLFLVIFYDIYTVISFASKTYVMSTPEIQPVFPLTFYLINISVSLVPGLGNMLMMLGIYRIGNIYNEINVRVGGMLIIVGFILSIVEIPIEIYGYLIAHSIIFPTIIIAVSLSVINSVLFFIGAYFAYQGLSKILQK